MQVREQREAHAQALFSRIMFLAVGLLGLVSVGFAVVLPYLLPRLASGFAPAKLALTTRLSYFLLPVTVVKGGGDDLRGGAERRGEERFSLVAPALIPATTIGFMLLWPVAATRIYALAAGTVAGMVGDLIVVSWSLKARGTTLRPWRAASRAASRQVVAQYFPLLTGAMLMSGTAFVDQAMAASLPAGDLASLSHGARLA